MMIRNELTILVDRPADDVFAYLTDFRNFPYFNSALGELDHAEEARMAVGGQFTLLTKVRGEDTPIRFEVVEYDPNKVFGFKSISPDVLPVIVHYYLEAVGGQTRLYYVEAMETGNIIDSARLNDLTRTRHDQIELDMQAVKAHFERA